jgi:RHH-type proline utilization regulon transcriptional repressor/proline dehydrogenase/delta 1-pyrroline-5-carboxylate dehydrogenase
VIDGIQNIQSVRPIDLADEAVALVRRWLVESAEAAAAPDAESEGLAEILKDPHGLEFTMSLVDGVARPDDLFVAGKNLQKSASTVPDFLPWYVRAAVAAGGVLGEVIPGIVVPISRRVLRKTLGELVIDASSDRLAPAIAAVKEKGDRLNLALVGAPVLGAAEAARRLAGTMALLARDDVDQVSVTISDVAGAMNLWAFDESVERVTELLLPLFLAALPENKVITFDAGEFRERDLTLAVFTGILSRPEFLAFEAGITVQAYLPDSLGTLNRLTEFAAERRGRGGAPIRVRLVKGANLPMERVDAALSGWPLATYGTKAETDANFTRVLDAALTAQRTDAVRVGIASHNLFDLALAWLLAKARGVEHEIAIELMFGMNTAHADAVRAEVGGSLVLYAPVVAPADFDGAATALVRRLEENASEGNFLAVAFDLSAQPALFERERTRFITALVALKEEPVPEPGSNRRQDRANAAPTAPRGPKFANTPDTDPAMPANRAWARHILARVGLPGPGSITLDACAVTDAAGIDDAAAAVRASALDWATLSGTERGAVLHRAGLALETNRARLIEVMATELGKTIGEADPEVSAAVDTAHYYAGQAGLLDGVDGATFLPSRLTVVASAGNVPVSSAASGVLGALAAGSGVILLPAPEARRSAAVMIEALWEAGIPRDLAVLVDLRDALGQDRLERVLVAHPSVDRVILTGTGDRVKRFRLWRAGGGLLAEAGSKNAIIVTPSADLDLAVAAIVESAFGNAGQKNAAAGLVIMVGSVGRSERFRRQLQDAVSSLQVGYPGDARAEVGPLIAPAAGKLLHALTSLGTGESWLVEPRKLSADGRLWSPGVRDGVQPDTYFALTEFQGPVLGLMRASSLEAAIDLQNSTTNGLTAGLFSLAAAEQELWLDRVEAGNLFVNRAITGAVVQRQPFGGWKRSAAGFGGKAGGPNYLVHLGSWASEPGEPSHGLSLTGLDARVVRLLDSVTGALPWEGFDQVRRGAQSDAEAWAGFFADSDVQALVLERNILRYRTIPTTIRLSDGGTLEELVRVLAAGTLTRSRLRLSSALKLPRPLRELLKEWDVKVAIEDDASWLSRVGAAAVEGGAGFPTPRIRLIGGSARDLEEALGAGADVAVAGGAVTRSGRIELLSFVHEQTVAITNHRFGGRIGE